MNRDQSFCALKGKHSNRLSIKLIFLALTHIFVLSDVFPDIRCLRKRESKYCTFVEVEVNLSEIKFRQNLKVRNFEEMTSRNDIFINLTMTQGHS